MKTYYVEDYLADRLESECPMNPPPRLRPSEILFQSIMDALKMKEYKNGIPTNDLKLSGRLAADSLCLDGILFCLVTNKGTFYKSIHEQKTHPQKTPPNGSHRKSPHAKRLLVEE